jgi:broad specificity phosphatase PhoE
MSPTATTVHLLRHGEVRNPTGVLYGRLAGYHLSDLGWAMAERVASVVKDRDVAAVVSSPLERAQETASPLASALGQLIHIEPRLIEAGNHFEGKTFGVGDGVLRRPEHWRFLWNPFRPSWGEPYAEIAARMRAALDAARDLARGREVFCVSHQLPIWTIRSAVEGRRLWHDPRKRQCTLASITSFTYSDDDIVSVEYSEPARDLLPVSAGATFSAGA